MAAFLTYEIYGKNSAGHRVSIQVRLLATPPAEVAEFLLREKYPSATDIKVMIPAAHKYPKPEPAPVQVRTLATTPVRRAS